MPGVIARVTSRAASAVRGAGRPVPEEQGPRPAQPLVLYEFEGCPFCRRVREAVSRLAVPVEVRPCPKNGERFRPEAIARAGTRSFPFLVDPNTDTQMIESIDIVRYLYDTYGTGEPPAGLVSGAFAASSQLAGLWRIGAGTMSAPSREVPDPPPALYGFESDPETRLVRERLCVRELPYVLHPTGGRVPRMTLGDEEHVGADAILAAIDAAWPA